MPKTVVKTFPDEFYPDLILNHIAFALGLTRLRKVSFSKQNLELYHHAGPTSVSIKYNEIDGIRVNGFFLKSVRFTTNSKNYYFRWLYKKQADNLLSKFHSAEELAWKNKYKKFQPEIINLVEWIEGINARLFFQRSSVFTKNEASANQVLMEFNSRDPKLVEVTVEALKLKKIRDFMTKGYEERTLINQEYINLEITRQTKLFDDIEKNPLTNEQRKSVVIDEDSNLVIAAAGSGKTSVIVSKTAWLLTKGLRKPNDLLLLAFARDAKNEMFERLEKRVKHSNIKDIGVHTFHSFGLEIISTTTGEKPSLSRLAEDDFALLNFIQSTVQKKLEDSTYKKIISRWFSEFFAPYKSQFDFENYGQYYDYLNTNNIRSLKAEKLKSYEECEIANFLFLNGINYVYEPDYEHKTADARRRQYKPDFYLPEYKIYIEHLGLRGFGRTAPFVDRKKYLQALRWKRDLHKRHKTNLIETYSCEKIHGNLLVNLTNKLLNAGVVFQEIKGDKIFEILRERGQIDPFTSLVKTFLGHFKGSQLNEKTIRKSGSVIEGAERNSAFIDVFIPIFEGYQNYLKEENAIDFHDMISMATRFIEQNKYKSPFRYIMVDEFQDISSGRAKLVSALQKSDPDVQLFCVGDDWQAIYRFAGSDINFMRDFSDNFGTFERSDLSMTFRCEEKITVEATNFIIKNEFQISKSVSSTNSTDQTSIYICFKGSSEEELLHSILSLIQVDEKLGENNNVLILGRYRLETYLKAYKINYHQILKHLSKEFDTLNISFKTVHRSKGLEADYVIILDVISDFLGFPNENADDHVLNMVLSKPEAYPNSEERRLFYVALTRAKKKVFINTQSGSVSKFVSEIIQSPYEFSLLGKNPDHEHRCPVCVQGELQLKKGSNGSFWGCSNYPRCENRSQACPHCGKGYPLKSGDREFNCQICEQSVKACPEQDCGGWLEQRNGKYGIFWGCTEYFSDTKQCQYTEKTKQ